VLHTIFLPGLLLFLIAVHFHFLKHRGISEPLRRSNETRSKVPLVPNMINRWLLLFLLVSVILGLVAWYWPAPLGDPADPTDSTFVPKPEWWVLFLNQLVGIFTGPFTVIGAAIIPGGLAGLLISLPFIDRSPERHPARRKKVMVAAAVLASILIALSIIGYVEHHIKPPQ
jgi:ubiquinol-cytochrome c reductase cytochrome b subunit